MVINLSDSDTIIVSVMCAVIFIAIYIPPAPAVTVRRRLLALLGGGLRGC